MPPDDNERGRPPEGPAPETATKTSTGIVRRKPRLRGWFRTTCPQHGEVRPLRKPALFLFDKPWFTCPVHHAEYWQARRREDAA